MIHGATQVRTLLSDPEEWIKSTILPCPVPPPLLCLPCRRAQEFKSRMKLGSGVRFDAEGFPVAVEEEDPVIQAAKKAAKARNRDWTRQPFFFFFFVYSRCTVR